MSTLTGACMEIYFVRSRKSWVHINGQCQTSVTTCLLLLPKEVGNLFASLQAQEVALRRAEELYGKQQQLLTMLQTKLVAITANFQNKLCPEADLALVRSSEAALTRNQLKLTALISTGYATYHSWPCIAAKYNTEYLSSAAGLFGVLRNHLLCDSSEYHSAKYGSHN